MYVIPVETNKGWMCSCDMIEFEYIDMSYQSLLQIVVISALLSSLCHLSVTEWQVRDGVEERKWNLMPGLSPVEINDRTPVSSVQFQCQDKDLFP